jgi:excinuclease UvrABC nuclease subunit
MDSAQVRINNKGLSDWFKFDEQLLRLAPEQSGVYIFRHAGAKMFGRLRGESDILYIGSTESHGGLKQRFSHYLHPGPTQWTNQRIHDLSKRYPLEIAWFVCDNPINIENSLLKQYLSEHDELPPLNHADVRRLKESLSTPMGFVDHVTVKLTKG